jgi:hypothetical protein
MLIRRTIEIAAVRQKMQLLGSPQGHYRKNTGCRAHYVMRCRTAKKALPCEATMTHGIPRTHDKGAENPMAKKHSWQRGRTTHGNVKQHGKNLTMRTAKRRRTTKDLMRCHDPNISVRHYTMHGKEAFAVRHDTMHGKGASAVHCILCSAQNSIFI